MTLDELERELARTLSSLKPKDEEGREIILEDEMTGIIARAYLKPDGHLGVVEEY